MLTLDTHREQKLRHSVHDTPAGAQLVLEPGEGSRVLQAIADKAERMTAMGQIFVLLYASAVRLPLSR